MKTKVEQIIADIENKVQANTLRFGDSLPSLSRVQVDYEVSRDTAVRAYRNSKSRGIIESRRGRGYRVANNVSDRQLNVFILLDELSEYKNTLVKSFAKALHNKATYKLFFHHFNQDVFAQLLSTQLGNFTHYVISPIPDAPELNAVLGKVPEHQLIFIDRCDTQELTPPFLGQLYRQDIKNSLNQLSDSLTQYSCFEFVFGQSKYHPNELKTGFRDFCQQHNIAHHIIVNPADIKLRKGSAYLVIDDELLAYIVKEARHKALHIGSDIGIVSYNETCLKSVIADGITTISTDFAKMGETLALMLQSPTFPERVHNPMLVLKRNSL
uniref:GntR family transcriptional regulator n=1 Tax=Ningiella ruwaisensis TaxID=2364274 RepID=UPI00109F43C2|nr:substrate-binding domain-containing protein [Ningiella ruwaisensis]